MRGWTLAGMVALAVAACGPSEKDSRQGADGASPATAEAPGGGGTFDLAGEVVSRSPEARTLTLRDRPSGLTRAVPVDASAAGGLADVEVADVIRVQCRGRAPAVSEPVAVTPGQAPSPGASPATGAAATSPGASALQACEAIVSLTPSGP